MRRQVPPWLVVAAVVVFTAGVTVSVLLYLDADPNPSPTSPPATQAPVGVSLFVELAHLPAGQEEVGTQAAQAWCEAVRTDDDVTRHGAVFDQFALRADVSRRALAIAAVEVYCSEYIGQLPKLRE